MSLRVLICLAVLGVTVPTASAAPFVPESDNQILERLPFAPDNPVLRKHPVESWQCALKARITSGGRFHPESCRFIR